MIRRRDLVRALGDHGLADWILVEREQDVAIADAQLRRAERWLRWQLTVHHDSPTGRGSAHVALDAADGDAGEVVAQAVELAKTSAGTPWVTRPPSAPARVTLVDPGLAKGNLVEAASALVQTVDRPADTTVDARAEILRERVNVVTRQGLRTEWSATRVRVDATVANGDALLVVTREARRRDDLALAAAIKGAADDLGTLAGAKPITPGPATLVLRAEAFLHGGLGVWAAFASQADAVVERQGLTRYRERAAIAPGAEQAVDKLTITSNGALDFGLASAPVGDEGEAVRRFTLVERGVAVGLGLTPREGALRGRDPNGGVRNLVVEPGSWSGTIEAGTTRVVEVLRLRSLSFDPYTGDASLEILVGIEHTASGRTPFTGGSLRIDAIAALARARRTKDPITRGAYSGPSAVLIESGELFA